VRDVASGQIISSTVAGTRTEADYLAISNKLWQLLILPSGTSHGLLEHSSIQSLVRLVAQDEGLTEDLGIKGMWHPQVHALALPN